MKKEYFEVKEITPLTSKGFSAFWKTCPELPWYKAMQKFHKINKEKESKDAKQD